MLGRAAYSCSRSGRRTMGVCADFWPEQWQDDRDTQSSRICTRCRQETQLRRAPALPKNISSSSFFLFQLLLCILAPLALITPNFTSQQSKVWAVKISPLFSQRWLNKINKIICRKQQKLLLIYFCQFLISSQCKNKWRHIY